jgi:hypothetical protein
VSRYVTDFGDRVDSGFFEFDAEDDESAWNAAKSRWWDTRYWRKSGPEFSNKAEVRLYRLVKVISAEEWQQKYLEIKREEAAQHKEDLAEYERLRKKLGKD